MEAVRHGRAYATALLSMLSQNSSSSGAIARPMAAMRDQSSAVTSSSLFAS